MAEQFVSLTSESAGRWFAKAVDLETKRVGPLASDDGISTGSGSEFMINTIEDDFNRPTRAKAGSTITSDIIHATVDKRFSGDREREEGREKILKTSNFKFEVHKMRSSIKDEMEMNFQRTGIKKLEKSIKFHALDAAREQERGFMAHASGLTGIAALDPSDPHDIRTANNAVEAWDSRYVLRPNSKATVHDLASGDEMDLDFVRELEVFLATRPGGIEPAKVKGMGEYYIALCHPAVISRMKQSDSVFFAVMNASEKEGLPTLLGRQRVMVKAENIIFVSTLFGTPGYDTSNQFVRKTARIPILGGDAIRQAYGADEVRSYSEGSRWRMTFQSKDYEEVESSCIKTIWGAKRVRYEERDDSNSFRERGILVETFVDLGSNIDDEQLYEPWASMGATFTDLSP